MLCFVFVSITSTLTHLSEFDNPSRQIKHISLVGADKRFKDCYHSSMANYLKRKVKKLTDLRLKEISGVDHPASLHEGWAVMKSSDNELEQALGEAIDNTNPDPMEKNVDELTTQDSLEAVEVEESVTLIEDDTVIKELADVRKELEQARAEVSDLREVSEIEKAERDAQRWAIVPQLDPEEFAPVLRSLRSADSESATKVEHILDAVAIALGEAGILKEVGSEGSPEADDSYGQIETMAKALVSEGTVNSLAEGISRVATDNPELYSAYVAEQRGA